LIDAARNAFAAGQFSRAFAELEAYEQIARTGVLDREARVLRIEILHRAGDQAQADSLTQQYLREFPSDEHAVRLRALSPRAEP
jgi:Tfp pilus assembly protein PilF